MDEDETVKQDKEELEDLGEEIDGLRHRLDEEDRKKQGPTFFEQVDEGEGGLPT